MPVWAALHHAEIVSCEPQTLGDVTDADVILEGIYPANGPYWRYPGSNHDYSWPMAAYRTEWDALNARRGYPWREDLGVWRIEFRLKGDTDATD